MKILIFGSTGMLGQALVKRLIEYQPISISHANLDLSQLSSINECIDFHKPQIVINCAGLISIERCEEDREYAFLVNSKAVATMAIACNQYSASLIQISTDHYYTGDNRIKHREEDNISLLNYYAHTKFMGEAYARLCDKALILRTNIVGFRGKATSPTFIEWAIDSILKQKKLSLFEDYFTSSIDIYHFSDVLKKLIDHKIFGLFNVGSSDVISKAEFIQKLSNQMNVKLSNYEITTISNQNNMVKRATTNGLDVQKLESILKHNVPSSDQVIKKIVEVYHDNK